MPQHLPSVSSLLLFNTNHNPYKKYQSLDNLESTNRKTREKEDKEVIADAPTTVKDGDSMPLHSQESVAYRPVLGQVPQIDLPSALPLSMVATEGFTFQG